MEEMRLQLWRIARCYRFISRHHPAVDLEDVAREWICRYARRWRLRHDQRDGTRERASDAV